MSLPFSPLVRLWAETPLNRVAAALEEARREPGRNAGEQPAGLTGQGQERGGFIDLVNANPHENGLVFPPDVLREIVEEAMRAESVGVYRPDPRGHEAAREAVAGFYRRRGLAADPQRILLTPGTSLAYFYALRLLTNPGDEILVPAPGYPLFDDICALCGVRTRAYHLRPPAEASAFSPPSPFPLAPESPSPSQPESDSKSGSASTGPAGSSAPGWRPDVEEIAFQCTPRTRAIMVVSPHNPTGCVFSAEDLEALGRLCRQRNLAMVFDEVFSEFLAEPDEDPDGTFNSRRGTLGATPKPPGEDMGGMRKPRKGNSDETSKPRREILGGTPKPPGERLLPRPNPQAFPLAITLNGFSKMFSLPGWKVGWMKVDGAAENVERLFKALEFLSDVFLPLPELTQAMIPGVLMRGDPAVSAALGREYARRRALALRLLACPVSRPRGGVYLIGRLPHQGRRAEQDQVDRTNRKDWEDDEAFCLRALRGHGVFVHPGYYYDLPAGYFVLTCVSSPDRLAKGIERINQALS